MKLMRRKCLWLTAVCLALTPLVARLAYIERGYVALGGEMALPLVPLLVWAFVRTGRDLLE